MLKNEPSASYAPTQVPKQIESVQVKNNAYPRSNFYNPFLHSFLYALCLFGLFVMFLCTKMDQMIKHNIM